jgi:glycosyltransferase involved in cell wall biosynthesis
MSSSPKVTVLMPLYNDARFLREAIASILTQTFTDFELLIIDDGSTDGSAEIAASFNDPRIRLVANGTNLGITASLNRGIDLAAGEYIARMDSDDISMPTRLAAQVGYLDKHSECAMVAVTVTMFDEDGQVCGTWADDRKTPTWEEIRRFLPRANCIAHPGIMIRKSVLSCYRYDVRHRVAQDYDLWLRMCADGLVIAKLAEPLIEYRINSASVTSLNKGRMPDLKNVRTKAMFLRRRLADGKLNGFCFRVFFAAFKDLFYAAAKGAPFFGLRSKTGVGGNLQASNRTISEETAASPPTMLDRDLRILEMNDWAAIRFLVAVGKVIGSLLPFRNGSSLFFFFPFLHVGGAERVHADIVNCFAERKPWVFFTKRSENSSFRSLYLPKARLFNFWALLKYGYPLSVGIVAGFVNRHRKPVVFGSNSLFYYLLIPLLSPDVRCIDLLHAFGGGAEYFSLHSVNRLDSRVVVSGGMPAELDRLYRTHGLDSSLLERVIIIENMVRLPDRLPEKGERPSLRVLYVGRGTDEKRVYLVGMAATRCRQKGISAEFTLVGDLQSEIEAADRENCRFRGVIADPSTMDQLYAEADVLLLTSSREGFPLVVMEAMAHGVVPVCTTVGGIARHVIHGINGFLVENSEEGKIVDDVVAALGILSRDSGLLGKLSRAAFDHARASFGPEKFHSAYRNLLDNR